jgi:hypothetical protein
MEKKKESLELLERNSKGKVNVKTLGLESKSKGRIHSNTQQQQLLKSPKNTGKQISFILLKY